MLNYHSVVLFVRDIKSARKFYTEILEQEIEYDYGNNISLKCGISLWQIQHRHEIAQNLFNKSESNKSAMELYFETEEFEKIVTKVKDINVKLFHDVKEENWGQFTIRFFDQEENLIEIGESIKTFVSRLIAKMTPEEVAAKTGIKLEDISKILA